MVFEVRIRIGFLFEPPVGAQAPAVGLLTGYLNFGFLHQLIRFPPPRIRTRSSSTAGSRP